MSTNNPAVDDDYVVKLPNGDARVMSIDELDAAFEAGKIHKDSLVLAPGTVIWTTLGVLAGLDDVAAPISVAPSSIAPMVLGGGDLDVDIALDNDDGGGFRPRRRAGKVVGLVFAGLALLAVSLGIKGAVGQAIATRAGEAALAAQPPAPPPLAPMPLPAPRPSPVVEAAPPPPAASSAAPAPAASKVTAKDKDKKKAKLPGAPKRK